MMWTRNWLTVIAVLSGVLLGEGNVAFHPGVIQRAVADAGSSSGFDVEGHRGARGLRPENTLPAFETALDLGVTTLELDLHYSADGVVVIWHDDRIPKDKCRVDPAAAAPLPPDPESGSVSDADLMISHLTLSQLQKYRCDRNPDVKRFPEQKNGPTTLAGDDYTLISLERLFDFVESYGQSPQKTSVQQMTAKRIQFNIETKRKPSNPEAINDGFDGVNPGPFERAIVTLVEARNLVERVIVQSFDQRSLWALHALNPDVRLAALSADFVGAAQLQDFAERGAAIWSPNHTTLTAQRINQAHAAGLRVIPWTVNDLNVLGRLVELGVDGVITDRPDLILMALE